MFESYNPYGSYSPYNPYNPYGPYSQQIQQLSKQNQQMYKPQNLIALQGKVVDSLDVVKATDIPYDGSISYFPLTDGSAIITKQLQQDGTSKMVVYKPVVEDEATKLNLGNQYVTENEFKELKEQLKNMDAVYITQADLKEQIKSVNNKDIKDMKDTIKTLKRKVEDIADDLRDKKEK